MPTLMKYRFKLTPGTFTEREHEQPHLLGKVLGSSCLDRAIHYTCKRLDPAKRWACSTPMGLTAVLTPRVQTNLQSDECLHSSAQHPSSLLSQILILQKSVYSIEHDWYHWNQWVSLQNQDAPTLKYDLWKQIQWPTEPVKEKKNLSIFTPFQPKCFLQVAWWMKSLKPNTIYKEKIVGRWGGLLKIT